MPKYRVVLTAKNVECCPLYESGDKTVVNLPDVDMEASDKVCGFVLAELLRQKMQMEKNMLCEMGEEMTNKAEYAAEFQVPEKVLQCPLVSSEVTFTVEIEERIDTDAVVTEYHGREDIQHAISQLREIPIFSDIETDSLSDIASKISLQQYAPGDIILKKGQRGQYFFVLYDGEVEVIQVSQDGDESVIGQLGSGDCFGEMSLLTNEAVSNTIRVSAESTMLLIAKEDFRVLIENNPQLRLKITKLLAQRIKSTNQRMGVVAGSGMVGQLQAIGFPDLVQTLATNESVGILHVSNQHAHGKVYFQAGHIIDAELADACGEECFHEMMMWNEGTFRFEEKQIDRERTIMYPDVTGLLLESMKRLDDMYRQQGGEEAMEFFNG